MAVLLQLYRGASDYIDLYGNTSGFQVAEWIPGRSIQKDDGTWPEVSTVITLRANGTSSNNLAANLQE